jgi:hypothetical protein
MGLLSLSSSLEPETWARSVWVPTSWARSFDLDCINVRPLLSTLDFSTRKAQVLFSTFQGSKRVSPRASSERRAGVSSAPSLEACTRLLLTRAARLVSFHRPLHSSTRSTESSLYFCIQVWSWGINDAAALGRITSNVPDPENPGKIIETEELETWPMIVPALLEEGFRAVSVAAGDSISVAVSAEGQVRAWGSFRVSRAPRPLPLRQPTEISLVPIVRRRSPWIRRIAQLVQVPVHPHSSPLPREAPVYVCRLRNGPRPRPDGRRIRLRVG